MEDRYRAYAPASSHDSDPRVDYPGHVPPEISSYYTSRAPVIPGDYTSRPPILPADYASRVPILPSDYTSRAPILPGEYTSRHPIVPADYASRAPILPGTYSSRPILPADYASRDPILPGEYTSRHPILPADYASRTPVLPGGADIINNDLPSQSRAYGLDGPAGVTNPVLPGLSGVPAEARAQGPSSLEDPPLAGRSELAPSKAQVEDAALIRSSSSLGKSAAIPDVEHHNPLTNLDRLSEDESNILFVDGLPSDCTRREVAHLFRPFIGFKDIKVVHKEPRRSGDKGYVLCFVEFENAKCASTAMEALQEYRFDDRKPDAPVLKIHFARFPFRPPGAKDDKKRLLMH